MTDNNINHLAKLLEEKDNMPFCTYKEEARWLLENGVIVPPCKVGQKFYWINFVTKEIETDIVVAIHQYESGFKITTNTIGSEITCTFILEKFLKIMFLTKEEAEAELQKRGKENA